jgi:hypothetical protein
MTLVVWKYELAFRAGWQTIELPIGAKILDVAFQGDPFLLHLWALVDPTTDSKEERSFAIYGTGHELEAGVAVEHVATAHHSVMTGWHGTWADPLAGAYVWHLFERRS